MLGNAAGGAVANGLTKVSQAMQSLVKLPLQAAKSVAGLAGDIGKLAANSNQATGIVGGFMQSIFK